MRRLLKYWWLRVARDRARLSVRESGFRLGLPHGLGPRWFSCCTSSSRAGRDRRGYGVYGYAIAFATLVGLFASLGFPQAALRFLPFYRVQSDWSRMRGLVQGGELLMLTTGGIATRLGTLALLLLGDGRSGCIAGAPANYTCAPPSYLL